MGERLLLAARRAGLRRPDFEWAFIDGTYVKAHQHSAGAASGKPEVIDQAAPVYVQHLLREAADARCAPGLPAARAC